MIQFGTAVNGQQHRRVAPIDGVNHHKGEWMRSEPSSDPAPTVFLAELQPLSTLFAHFHQENQFQVFVKGSGSIGRHPVSVGSVHYAGAYSGYGPLAAGPDGLQYFTFRTAPDPGPQDTVKCRDRQLQGPRKVLNGSVPDLPDDGTGAYSLILEEDVIPMQQDSTRAAHIILPAGTHLPTRETTGSAGNFLLVLNGSIDYGERALRQWESIFYTPDEPICKTKAGSGGARLLYLQLANKSAEYP